MANQYFITVILDKMPFSDWDMEIIKAVTERFDRVLWNKDLDSLSECLKKMANGILEAHGENDFECRNYTTGGNSSYIRSGLFALKIEVVKNALPRYHVQMPENWMERLYAEFQNFPENEKRILFEDEVEKVSDWIKSKNESTIITTFNEKYPGWKIEVVDFVHSQPDLPSIKSPKTPSR
jgi:hypothetical protein